MNAKQRKAAQAAQKAMVTDAIALGILFAVYKFVPHQAAKAAAVGVAGVIVAAYVPFVGEAIA